MKMVDSGQNYARLREAFRRLSGFSVTVERVTETNEKLAILPVFETSNIPRLHSSPKVTPIQGHESAEQEYEQTGILFGSTFYKEIVRHHVPFPLDVLRSLYRKPQMSDYMKFLHWRVFAAQSETVIPWSMMREQLWQEDSNLYRMRTRFREVIKAFKIVWPDLTAEARPASLYIARGLHAYRRELTNRGRAHTPNLFDRHSWQYGCEMRDRAGRKRLGTPAASSQ